MPWTSSRQEPVSPGTVLDDATLAVERADARQRRRDEQERQDEDGPNAPRTRPASGRARAGARAAGPRGSRPGGGRRRARPARRRATTEPGVAQEERGPGERATRRRPGGWVPPPPSRSARSRPRGVLPRRSGERERPAPARPRSGSAGRAARRCRQEPAERTAGGDREVVLGQPFRGSAGRSRAGRGRRVPRRRARRATTLNTGQSGRPAIPPKRLIGTRPSASSGSSASATRSPIGRATGEGEDEGREVDRQGHDPQERHRRDVGRQLGGGPDTRAAGMAAKPTQPRRRDRSVADRRRAPFMPGPGSARASTTAPARSRRRTRRSQTPTVVPARRDRSSAR